VSLSSRGIISGFKDAAGNPSGKFGPGYLVTLAEVLKMALRSAGVDETMCRGTLKNPGATKHWARQFVLCAEERSIRVFKNFPNLDRPALRGEVLAIIDDAFAATVPAVPSIFNDTKGHVYERDIAYAAKRGIVSGDINAEGHATGTFRPNDRINRAEVAKMIYLQSQGVTPDPLEGAFTSMPMLHFDAPVNPLDAFFVAEDIAGFHYHARATMNYCGGIVQLQSQNCRTHRAEYAPSTADQDGIGIHISVHDLLEGTANDTIAKEFSKGSLVPKTFGEHRAYMVHSYFGSYYYWLSGAHEITIRAPVNCSIEFLSSIEATGKFEGATLTPETIALLKTTCKAFDQIALRYFTKYPSDL
jgi:hypothetical protein